jgi:gamma-glutamylcyclotransferase (GGCT)/AIG2-like uncharacterized protein YtfP
VDELVFFYGTLMAGFGNRRTVNLESCLRYAGRGSIRAALFDLGPYPGAVPAADSVVWGELYGISDSAVVLATLDALEGCSFADRAGSLYVRVASTVTREDGSQAQAWVYFYNQPLGQARPIPLGDYRAYAGAAHHDPCSGK